MIVAIHDTPENILDRITFYDIDSRPIDKHLTGEERILYLKEIKADIAHFKRSYARADLQVIITGLDPEASPAACTDVTHSTANGRSSMSAMPGSSSPAAVCSAGSSSSGPGAFQNGATDSAAARALTKSPASSRALGSVSAHDGDASARAAKACCRGHTPTAARRYQRSIVLP